jgi:hypothetical protein
MAPDSPEASAPASSEEWSARAVDAVDSVVDVVHDKVVRPALIAGRAVVFGLLIGFVSLVLVLLVAVAVVRLLDVYAFGGRVWASDALFGVILSGAGVVLWSLRSRRRASD